MTETKTALILSAHAADFVWRCGGAIALHEKLGYKVTVACMSYGERGESAKLWKQSGMTLEKVKSNRKKEAEKAAKAPAVEAKKEESPMAENKTEKKLENTLEKK